MESLSPYRVHHSRNEGMRVSKVSAKDQLKAMRLEIESLQLDKGIEVTSVSPMSKD